ncbi:MAG: hypothetical protein ACOZCL_02960 [Bacillota bacterium]
MYIAGFVIGLISFIIGIIPLVGWLAVPFNVIAVCIGLFGIFRRSELFRTDYNFAVASLILGGIPLLLKYIIWS